MKDAETGIKQLFVMIVWYKICRHISLWHFWNNNGT